MGFLPSARVGKRRAATSMGARGARRIQVKFGNQGVWVFQHWQFNAAMVARGFGQRQRPKGERQLAWGCAGR